MGQRGDVYQLIKMCDLAILSSHWEGFGLSAVEAMACGVPLIASNVSGLSQVVADGGLTFEKGNEKDLVKKSNIFLKTKNRKISWFN
ncbi:glycosyltransferase [Niabella hibiscisoli]|nr:glycosyltransferase [Niabella hibiscisoli]MCH5719945.1 glycosyltransferase [Niabella hibiscisoli]